MNYQMINYHTSINASNLQLLHTYFMPKKRQ